MIKKVFFWFPETINGKKYWLCSRWVEIDRHIIHGIADGCNRDIWRTDYIRVLTPLEKAMK